MLPLDHQAPPSFADIQVSGWVFSVLIMAQPWEKGLAAWFRARKRLACAFAPAPWPVSSARHAHFLVGWRLHTREGECCSGPWVTSNQFRAAFLQKKQNKKTIYSKVVNFCPKISCFLGVANVIVTVIFEVYHLGKLKLRSYDTS